MSDSKPMKEVWEIRERISSELASLSDEDFLAYFREKRSEWATPDQIEAMERLMKSRPLSNEATNPQE